MYCRPSTVFLLFVALGSSLVTFGGAAIGAWVFFFLALLVSAIARSSYLATILALALLILGVPLLMPVICADRATAYRLACACTMKQIAIALHNYQDANGFFLRHTSLTRTASRCTVGER